MSAWGSLNLECPSCGQGFAARVWTVVNADEDPELRDQLLAHELNVVICPHCGHESLVASPFIYHHQRFRQALCYVPEDWGDEEERAAIARALVLKLLQELAPERPADYLLEPIMFGSVGTLAEVVRYTGAAKGGSEVAGERRQQLTTALGHLTRVQSDEELVQVLSEHPELLSVETQTLLQELARQVERAGRLDVADYYLSIAAFLREQREALEHSQPPSVEEIAQALQVLMQVETREELEAVLEAYPELHEPEALAAVTYMADRAQQEGQFELAQMLEAIRELLIEVANAPPPTELASPEEVTAAVRSLLQVATTEQALELIDQEPALRTPQAIALMQEASAAAWEAGEEALAQHYETLAELLTLAGAEEE